MQPSAMGLIAEVIFKFDRALARIGNERNAARTRTGLNLGKASAPSPEVYHGVNSHSMRVQKSVLS